MSPSDYCAVLGEVLTSLRKRQGLTTDEVAKQLGIRNTYVEAYEQGTLRPPLKVLHGLTTVYHVGLLRMLASAIESDPERIPASLDGPDATRVETALLTFAERPSAGSRLKALRTAHHLTVKGLAKHLGIHPTTLTNWEKRRPTLPALNLLAPFYGHTFLTLLVHVVSPTPQTPKLTLSQSDVGMIERAVLAWAAGRGTFLVAQQEARSLPVVQDQFLVRLGHTLQDRRVSQGWSLEQLAQRAKVLMSDLGAYEYGLTRIPFASLDDLGRALGFSMLGCLVHAAEPALADVPDRIGGDDAGAIETALRHWDLSRPGRSVDGVSDGTLRDNPTTVLMGQRLRELREARGLCRSAVVHDLPISWANLRFIEKGLVRPSLTHLHALAGRYGLSLLPLLLHLTAPVSTEPPSTLGDSAVGGNDADRIVATLLTWSAETGRSNPNRDNVPDSLQVDTMPHDRPDTRALC